MRSVAPVLFVPHTRSRLVTGRRACPKSRAGSKQQNRVESEVGWAVEFHAVRVRGGTDTGDKVRAAARVGRKGYEEAALLTEGVAARFPYIVLVSDAASPETVAKLARDGGGSPARREHNEHVVGFRSHSLAEEFLSTLKAKGLEPTLHTGAALERSVHVTRLPQEEDVASFFRERCRPSCVRWEKALEIRLGVSKEVLAVFRSADEASRAARLMRLCWPDACVHVSKMTSLHLLRTAHLALRRGLILLRSSVQDTVVQGVKSRRSLAALCPEVNSDSYGDFNYERERKAHDFFRRVLAELPYCELLRFLPEWPERPSREVEEAKAGWTVQFVGLHRDTKVGEVEDIARCLGQVNFPPRIESTFDGRVRAYIEFSDASAASVCEELVKEEPSIRILNHLKPIRNHRRPRFKGTFGDLRQSVLKLSQHSRNRGMPTKRILRRYCEHRLEDAIRDAYRFLAINDPRAESVMVWMARQCKLKPLMNFRRPSFERSLIRTILADPMQTPKHTQNQGSAAPVADTEQSDTARRVRGERQSPSKEGTRALREEAPDSPGGVPLSQKPPGFSLPDFSPMPPRFLLGSPPPPSSSVGKVVSRKRRKGRRGGGNVMPDVMQDVLPAARLNDRKGTKCTQVPRP
eukprot:Hpha_TRINITY_DN6704_c0_g1::TRINITY_DN6704_c0_g1_i1::g.111078::m.111078